MSYSSFQEFSKVVVKDFIQNVVLIDDMASFEIKKEPESLVVPTKKKRRVEKRIDDTEHVQTSIDSAHSLNAHEITQSFLENGLLCTVIKPTSLEKIESIALVADKADVVILDWKLNLISEDKSKSLEEDYTNDALELLNKIIDRDIKNSPRLRVIVVYTGETLISVYESIRNLLRAKRIKVEIEDSKGLCCGNDNLRIKIIGKKILNKSKNCCDESELPDVVLSEFSKMTDGLLPSFVLHAFSSIRKLSSFF